MAELVEAVFRRFLLEHFPQWQVKISPGLVDAGARKLITVHATNTPVNGVLGRSSVIDVEMFDTDSAELLRTADLVVAKLEQGFKDGLLPVSSLRWVLFPSLAVNRGDVKSAAVCGFTFQVWAHYMP